MSTLNSQSAVAAELAAVYQQARDGKLSASDAAMLSVALVNLADVVRRAKREQRAQKFDAPFRKLDRALGL